MLGNAAFATSIASWIEAGLLFDHLEVGQRVGEGLGEKHMR